MTTQSQMLPYPRALSLCGKEQRDKPVKILCPTEFFPTDNQGQDHLLNEFIKVLERYLGIERTVFSIRERWSSEPPKEALGQPLEEYLQDVSQ